MVQTKFIIMLTKESSTKIVNFMTPGEDFLLLERGHTSHIVKMHYYFKKLLLYSQAYFRQTKSVVMMIKERSTKVVNLMNPGAGFLVLGCGHISHIVEMQYFFKNLLLYSQA